MNKKALYYESVLKKSQNLNYLEPARQTMTLFKANTQEDIVLTSVTSLVTAPVLLAYTAWVLFDAQKRGVRRLYFMARDGFIMYRMALSLCEAWGIDLECRYFYCSRYVLRLPLYIFAREYALDLMFQRGAYTTALMVLLRAGIKQHDAFEILSVIDWPAQRRLNSSDFGILRTRLLNDSPFDQFATEAAIQAEKQVRAYFIQECGDTASVPFALVDSGWLGSIQEGFFRVYSHVFNRPANLDGYYFGMFARGNPQSGHYHCWFFSPDKQFHRIRNFNNNLFECLCAADHGMTVGYEEKAGKWVPVFKREIGYGHAHFQNSICEMYTRFFVNMNPICHEAPSFESEAYALLKSLMAFPSKDEAKFFSELEFSDDATDTGMKTLAEPFSLRRYWPQSLCGTLIRKIFGKREEHYAPSFWIEGAVELSSINYLMKLDMCFLRLVKYWWMVIKLNYNRHGKLSPL